MSQSLPTVCRAHGPALAFPAIWGNEHRRWDHTHQRMHNMRRETLRVVQTKARHHQPRQVAQRVTLAAKSLPPCSLWPQNPGLSLLLTHLLGPPTRQCRRQCHLDAPSLHRQTLLFLMARRQLSPWRPSGRRTADWYCLCKRGQGQTWGDAAAEKNEREPGRVRVDGPTEERERLRAEVEPVAGTATSPREADSSTSCHRPPSLAAGDGVELHV